MSWNFISKLTFVKHKQLVCCVRILCVHSHASIKITCLHNNEIRTILYQKDDLTVMRKKDDMDFIPIADIWLKRSHKNSPKNILAFARFPTCSNHSQSAAMPAFMNIPLRKDCFFLCLMVNEAYPCDFIWNMHIFIQTSTVHFVYCMYAYIRRQLLFNFWWNEIEEMQFYDFVSSASFVVYVSLSSSISQWYYLSGCFGVDGEGLESCFYQVVLSTQDRTA